MRRNVVLFTTMLCLLFIYSMTTKASVEGYENGFFYRIKNGTAEIVGIDDALISSRITLPSTLAGKKVTALGNDIFCGSNSVNNLTSVTIPDTVTTMGGKDDTSDVKKYQDSLLSVTLNRPLRNTLRKKALPSTCSLPQKLWVMVRLHRKRLLV